MKTGNCFYGTLMDIKMDSNFLKHYRVHRRLHILTNKIYEIRKYRESFSKSFMCMPEFTIIDNSNLIPKQWHVECYCNFNCGFKYAELRIKDELDKFINIRLDYDELFVNEKVFGVFDIFQRYIKDRKIFVKTNMSSTKEAYKFFITAEKAIERELKKFYDMSEQSKIIEIELQDKIGEIND